MADENIVRKITIVANGENLDSTTTSMKALGSASVATAKASNDAEDAFTAQTDALVANNAALRDLVTVQERYGKATRDISAANDNESGGFASRGLEVGVLANHLRQATVAAYAFSPAFRETVNAMALPFLKATGTALEGVASGLVTGTNVAGRGLVALSTAAATTSPALAPIAGYVGSAGAAMAAFSPTITGVAASLLTRLLPALRLFGAVQFLVDAWQAATGKLKEYNDISNNAIGLSTDFYQRIKQGAEASHTSVESLVELFKNLNEAMKPALGGSTGQKRLDELIEAGNFKGNTGVAQLKAANDPEGQLRAVAALYRQAADAQERLAGIDMAKTVLGKDVADNLLKDNDYLDDMIRKADTLAQSKLVPDSELARAEQLKVRYEAAVKTLTEKWQPFQNLIIEIGIKMHETFTQDLDDLAKLFSLFSKIFDKASDLVNLAWDKIKRGTVSAVNAVAGAEVLQNPDKIGPEPITTDTAYDLAKQRLASGLKQPVQIKNAKALSNAIYDAVKRDKSGNPDDDDDKESAWERASGALRKYIEVNKAAAQSVDATAYEHERLKAIAELTAAGIKDGLTPEAAKLKAEMSGLSKEAGSAADALARAKINSQIKFDRATAFLSPEDVQIATQLKSLYGDDIPKALSSTEAAGIRTNNALKELGGIVHTAFDSMTPAIRDAINGTTSLASGFKNLGLVAVKALEDMIIKLTIIKPLESAVMGGFGGGLGSFFGVGGGSSGGGGIWTVPGDLGAGTGGLSFPKFASGTDSAPGGYSIVGEEGPELVNLPRGAGVTPNKLTMAALGNSPVHVNYAPTYNVTGSGPEIAALKAQIAQDRAEFETRTIAAVRKARTGRNLR